MKSLLMIFLMVVGGCRTTDRYSETVSLAKSGDCEAAVEKANKDWADSLTDAGRITVGTASSYAVTGTGYVADAAIVMVRGVAVLTIGCPQLWVILPLVLANKGPDINPNIELPCLEENRLVKAVTAPLKGSRGEEAYAATKDWREEDVSPLNKALREAVLCYEKRGDEKSLIKAYLQAKQISGIEFISVELEQRNLVEGDIERIKGKLVQMDPKNLKKLEEEEKNLEKARGEETKEVIDLIDAKK